MSCAAANKAAKSTTILVLDASATHATRDVCESLIGQIGASLRLIYRRANHAGLARQRNEAVAICRQLGAEIIHFIDDDTEVSADYFAAIEQRLAADPAIAGVGGIIVNQPTVRFVGLKRLFLLGSRKRGTVLRSGRNILGQYPGTAASDHVDWLSGCSMSFRITAFDGLAFDSALQGYSFGEDYDFTFRVSRRHRLAVEPSALCVHHLTPTMRGSRRTHARLRTEATHRWVKQNRIFGMSAAAFWWSVLGEFLLSLGHGVFYGDRDSLHTARGVVDGVRAIALSAGHT